MVLVLILSINSYSQQVNDTIKTTLYHEIKGTLLDLDKQTALPYANIIVLHKKKGTITNENGNFSLNISKLNKNDTISFQYIGYETKKLTIKQLDSSAVVNLKENINNLSEIFVFSKDLNAESIVKKVLDNKDTNYKKDYLKNQTFIRSRSISDINKFKLDFKKSSLPELSEERIKSIEKKIPKHSVSFTDFLADLYFSNNNKDSVSLKIDPIKMVGLKDKNLADMEQLESIFEKILSNTKEKEYWKMKSGIIGGKIQMDNDINQVEKDSLKAISERKIKTKYLGYSTNNLLHYSSFKDKEDWDFLYHTNRYDFSLAGGTTVNGEDVYIIDFVSKRKGKYEGRIYIALKTFALVRADYTFAEGKTGTNIHLFGVGYSENGFSGSISFEKQFGTYHLKYCSKKESSLISFDRNIALIKKKKRFLIDKTQNEIKVKLKISVSEEHSSEMFVLNQEKISEKQFKELKQKEFVKMLYVGQFDDKIWKDYPIIEPTKQMREYKKIDEE